MFFFRVFFMVFDAVILMHISSVLDGCVRY